MRSKLQGYAARIATLETDLAQAQQALQALQREEDGLVSALSALLQKLTVAEKRVYGSLLDELGVESLQQLETEMVGKLRENEAMQAECRTHIALLQTKKKYGRERLQSAQRELAEQAAAQGWLERGDVMRLLGVSRTAARQQLLRLREAGVLVRVGERYYPAGAVTPPEEQLAVIQTYLREHGSGRRQDFLRLLNVSPAQGTQILRRLTARGELILTGRRYTLPKGK